MSELIPAGLSSLFLVALAEIGDKSQLVCMTLAARHPHWPVLLGASLAFAVLNLLAVSFGAVVSSWLPEMWIALVVALIFAAFGVQALLHAERQEDNVARQKGGQGIFLGAFALIFLAEFGDKTQLAVAGLASRMSPGAVWLGATLALVILSALAVWVGRKLLQRLPLTWLHRASGILFLSFSAIAAWQAYQAWHHG